MPKEKKKLTLKELKEISPLTEAFELFPHRKYMIVIKKPSIIGMDQSSSIAIAKEIARVCVAHKIPVQIIANIDLSDVKFFEVS